MHLSRIRIQNFRNFSDLDIALAGNVVVVGENRVGKTNLVHALRLILDPTLPDSARQLRMSDFWDELENPVADERIVASVEITEFEDDNDVLAVLTDYRLDDDAQTVRLTYEFRPRAISRPTLRPTMTMSSSAMEVKTKQTLRIRAAQQDQVGCPTRTQRCRGRLGDLATIPTAPPIEDAFSAVNRADLDEISEAIEAATEKMADFDG